MFIEFRECKINVFGKSKAIEMIYINDEKIAYLKKRTPLITTIYLLDGTKIDVVGNIQEIYRRLDNEARR